MKTASATIVALGLATALTGAAAALDAHGPDAWRVTGVGAGDALNVRMGPGTGYPAIGAFAPDARGLRQVTCVPLVTQEQFMAMTEAQHAALPPRWCLMTDAGGGTRGWVAARFLAEDDGTPLPAEQVGTAAPAQEAAVAAQGGDAVLGEAESLVRALYSAHALAMRGGGQSPLELPRARDFFSSEVFPTLAAGLGADPLYDAQDTDISNLRVARDPVEPMFRGMITVHADFHNFGHPRRATFRLRPDTGHPGAPVRIFAIEHEGWVFQ